MSRPSDEQEQRLLDEKDTGENFDGGVEIPKDLRLRFLFILPYNLIACFLFGYAVLSTALLLWALGSNHVSHISPYSPVNGHVDYQVQSVHADPRSVFMEEPSPEHNKAWEDLLGPMHQWATKNELEMSNDHPADRLMLVEPKGHYLATLGVYHELHCLRRIYWHFYPDIYLVNITAENMVEERGHARHCIETIRQSLICTPNLALYSFKWRGEGLKPLLMTGGERKCVKWNPIANWAQSRATGWNPLVWRPKNDTTIESM